MRHGLDLEEMGGTKIDKVDSRCTTLASASRIFTDCEATENEKGFLDHYLEELKDQFKGSGKR